MKVKRLLSATVLALASVLPLALAAAAPTSAYASGTAFHGAITEHCDNPSFCGNQNLGGFSGSAQFNSDGTASGQLTGCSHLQGGGPAAGAQHEQDAIADLNGQPGWFVGPNGDIWVTNSTDTFTGRSGGPPVTVFDPFPPYPGDTGIPAAPGHYTITQLFGFTPPPGVSFQIQVTQLPGGLGPHRALARTGLSHHAHNLVTSGHPFRRPSIGETMKPAMVFAAVVAAAALATGASAVGDARAEARPTPKITVLTSGLENPRGLTFGPDGSLYVAEGGVGGTASTIGQCPQVPGAGPYTGGMTARISRVDVHTGTRATIVDGLPSSTTSAAVGSFVTGVADVAFIGHQLYAVEAGAGCSHGVAGTVNAVLRVDTEHHRVTQLADLSAFLMSHPAANPDPADFEPDGTWYSLVSAEGLLYAVEPNHQEVDTVTPDGQVSRVIDISQTFPGNTNWQGPTGIVRDGENFYLVNLNPFAPGSDGHASLWKLTDDGQLSHITSGLTAAVGVAVHDGQIYALEAFTGFFAPAPFVAHTGMVVRLDRQGGWDPIVTGLNFPTAMTFGPDGNLYISNNGFGQPTNTAGEILRVDLT